MFLLMEDLFCVHISFRDLEVISYYYLKIQMVHTKQIIVLSLPPIIKIFL